MPDELCEVLEICDGTSLISSAIISCGVHHLHELRRRKKRSFVIERGLFLQLQFSVGQDEEGTRLTSGTIKSN